MYIYNYNNYFYLTNDKKLFKKDFDNIIKFIVTDLKKDIKNISAEVIENTQKALKRGAFYNNIKSHINQNRLEFTLYTDNQNQFINKKSKLINFTFYDITKHKQLNYISIINEYLQKNNNINVALKMSGHTKQAYNLEQITDQKIIFTYNEKIKSTLQLNYCKVEIKNGALYIYLLDKPTTFYINDKNFLEFLASKKRHIKKARGTIAPAQTIVKKEEATPAEPAPEEAQTASVDNKQASSGDTPKEHTNATTDDKILQAYNDLKSQNFSDCKYELLGKWLWVTTLSEQVKNYLLEHGFKFSLQHLKFYLHFDEYKKRSNTVLSFDKIKELYGGTI